MSVEQNLLALILGGGAGTRLFPLTRQRAKPAVPLGGKYRLVDIPISNCINSDVTKILILTQYNSASLNRHIARTYRFSHFSDGFVEILAAEQTPENPEWFHGTADAVRQVLPNIQDWGVELLLILSGDHLYRMDYRDFLRRHSETNADVTISVIPCAPEVASSFGLLKTDPTGRILEFSEKPQGAALEAMRVDTTKFGLSVDEAKQKPFLASMGIYLFKYNFLDDVLKKNLSLLDFGSQVIPAMLQNCNVQAYLFNGYWEDIGSLSSFYNANLDMISPEPKFSFFNAKAPIYTRPRYLPPSIIDDCEVRRTIISEGCNIRGAKLHHSIIGIRSQIGCTVLIEASVLMGADVYQSMEEIRADVKKGIPPIGIGEDTIIRRAIIDKNARIGTKVRLLNERGVEHADGPEGSYYIRDRIIVVPKNAVITDNSLV